MSSSAKKPTFKSGKGNGKVARSKKDVIVLLAAQLGTITDELLRINEKVMNIQRILECLLEESDDPTQNDINLDQDVEYEDEELDVLEFDGVEYKIGDTVELYDSVNKRWTKKTARIFRFCDKMARMKTSDGKKTKRKYGNFRKH